MNDDIQAVKNLVYGYPEAFDTGDFEAAVALFARASVRVAGRPETFRGDAVRSLLTGMVQLYDGTPRTKHLTTNVIVEVDAGAGAASARSYFVALQALPDFPLQPILAGSWHDRFVKAEGCWRFDERVIHVDLMGDISRHLISGTGG